MHAGHQPQIPPGRCFEYTSGVDLDTPTGLQRGGLLVRGWVQEGGGGPAGTWLGAGGGGGVPAGACGAD